MLRKSFRWMRTHRKTALGMFLLFVFLLLNLVAFLHSRAMTHFAPEGVRTAKPEFLSILGKAQVLLTGITVPKPSAGNTTPKDVGLPFEVHHLPGKNEVELEAWYVPCSRPQGLVLLFHGYAGCKADLLNVAVELHALGYASLLVDFRGSGGSSSSETTIGVTEAEDVALALDYAQSRWSGQPLILYGQSMGSAAILRALAIEGVQAKAVILECPFDRLLTTVAVRFTAMGLPAFPFAHLLVFWGGVQHGFNGFEHNPIDYAARVDCPVLLMHGARDHRVTTEQARSIFDALGGPKEFELFADAGHESYAARQPERWRAVLAGFLSRYAKPVPNP